MKLNKTKGMKQIKVDQKKVNQLQDVLTRNTMELQLFNTYVPKWLQLCMRFIPVVRNRLAYEIGTADNDFSKMILMRKKFFSQKTLIIAKTFGDKNLQVIRTKKPA